MNEEMQALEENHIWDFVGCPENIKMLRKKWGYKLRYNINCKMSWYKLGCIAKEFKQKEGIDFEQNFSLFIKSCTMHILLLLATFYDREIEQINTLLQI